MNNFKYFYDKYFRNDAEQHYKTGTSGKHEAIYGCYIIQEIIETYLLQHMGVLNNKKAFDVLEQAQDLVCKAHNVLASEKFKGKFHDLDYGVEFKTNNEHAKSHYVKVVPYLYEGCVIVAQTKCKSHRLLAEFCVDLDVEEI